MEFNNIILLVSLLLSIASFVFVFRQRRKEFQLTIYKLQVEACNELLESLIVLHKNGIEYYKELIKLQKEFIDEQKIDIELIITKNKLVKDKLMKLFHQTDIIFLKNYIILPEAIILEGTRYLADFEENISLDINEKKEFMDLKEKLEDNSPPSLVKLVQTMRVTLKMDILDKAIQNFLSKY